MRAKFWWRVTLSRAETQEKSIKSDKLLIARVHSLFTWVPVRSVGVNMLASRHSHSPGGTQGISKRLKTKLGPRTALWRKPGLWLWECENNDNWRSEKQKPWGAVQKGNLLAKSAKMFHGKWWAGPLQEERKMTSASGHYVILYDYFSFRCRNV